MQHGRRDFYERGGAGGPLDAEVLDKVGNDLVRLLLSFVGHFNLANMMSRFRDNIELAILHIKIDAIDRYLLGPFTVNFTDAIERYTRHAFVLAIVNRPIE